MDFEDLLSAAEYALRSAMNAVETANQLAKLFKLLDDIDIEMLRRFSN